MFNDDYSLLNGLLETKVRYHLPKLTDPEEPLLKFSVT